MSNRSGGLGASGPGQSDPAGGIIAALGSLVGQGLSAWQAVADGVLSAAGRGGQPESGPLGAMADMAVAMGAALPGAGHLGEAVAGGQTASAEVAEMWPAISQACMVAAASTLRYGRALAEIMARHQASLMQAVVDRAAGEAAGDPSECRMLADDLRAYLREIGDAAMQEARRLQHELDMVGESIAATADEATSPPLAPGVPRPRRHQVKE